MKRPDLHFTPATGWMNDPNGLVYDGRLYHLFYQSTPGATTPDFYHMHWGHAVSPDLTSWEHLPPALYPDEMGGVFSGSAVMDGDEMVLMFTCHDKNDVERQAIARSVDASFTKFERHPGNPVIDNPGLKDFRDPKVFLKDEGGLWHAALAATDRVLFYTSPDLVHWTAAGAFGAPDFKVDGLWECPDLIQLSAPDGTVKWALIFSLGLPPEAGGGKTMYLLGDYQGGRFRPDEALARPVDMGPDFYAGVTFWGAPEGRKIMIAWMSNWAYAARTPSEGWRGQMSCPRELSLVKTWDGLRLASRPLVPESAIQRTDADGGEMLLVRDLYSVEMFLPEKGISFTQTFF
jgi:fructan beta-fructosidase